MCVCRISTCNDSEKVALIINAVRWDCIVLYRVVLYCIVLYNFIVHLSGKLSLAHQHNIINNNIHSTIKTQSLVTLHKRG